MNLTDPIDRPVMRTFWPLSVLVLVLSLSAVLAAEEAGATLDFERLASIRDVTEVAISPDGTRIAYVMRVPRQPGVDDNGNAWKELWVVDTEQGEPRPYLSGKVSVSKVRFTPDGQFLTYLAKRDDDEQVALWAIPVSGGESLRWVEFESKIQDYRVAPDGSRVAFLADEPKSEERLAAVEAGYVQRVFEEDWSARRVWLIALKGESAGAAPEGQSSLPPTPTPLPIEGSVFNLEWLPDGSALALAVAPTPLIDDRYMLQRIRIHAVDDGKPLARLENPGKLGAMSISPDGRHVALISAQDAHDPKEGRLLVGPTAGGTLRDLLPRLEGHVSAIGWKDADTLVFLADVGTETRLGEVDLDGSAPRTHARSGPAKGGERVPIMTRLALSRDGGQAALVGERPDHPAEIYSIELGSSKLQRRTHVNPWLDRLELAEQSVARWKTRDGMELEGILIEPLGGSSGAAPMIMIVHGGPEGHLRNGWVTGYSRPGQLAAAGGYAVFYPNYRGSTGRGVAFSKLGQGDAAGGEFDDLVDAVQSLAERGIVDRERVGVTGGSYGGYATAWCATRHTEHFRAGVMFVGISNKVSKGLTTEIPNEDRMVHTLFDPWTRWQFSLERSPIFHVEKSRTALLIAHGDDDTRVHPSQSLQLYRALKLIGKSPVRYVRYPGEGHGNTTAAGRDDYARRLMRWMDHYLVEDGEGLPPWELLPALATAKTDDDDGNE